MIKKCKGRTIKEKLKTTAATDKHNVFVKSFPGAKTDQMKHFATPFISEKPDHIILHTGTSDLSTDYNEKEIAESIDDTMKGLRNKPGQGGHDPP